MHLERHPNPTWSHRAGPGFSFYSSNITGVLLLLSLCLCCPFCRNVLDGSGSFHHSVLSSQCPFFRVGGWCSRPRYSHLVSLLTVRTPRYCFIYLFTPWLPTHPQSPARVPGRQGRGLLVFAALSPRPRRVWENWWAGSNQRGGQGKKE